MRIKMPDKIWIFCGITNKDNIFGTSLVGTYVEPKNVVFITDNVIFDNYNQYY